MEKQTHNMSSTLLEQYYNEYKVQRCPEHFLNLLLTDLDNSSLNIAINGNLALDADQWIIDVNSKDNFEVQQGERKPIFKVSSNLAAESIVDQYNTSDRVIITTIFICEDKLILSIASIKNL